MSWPPPDDAGQGGQAQPGQDGAPDQAPVSGASHTLADMARQSGTVLARLAQAAPRADQGAAAQSPTQAASGLNLDASGLVQNPKVKQAIDPGRHIERGPMPQVNGIVIHQTGAPTAASTFNSYANPGANGAHFLIDKDGTIYQTASLHKTTNHVGRLRSRCEAEHSCPQSNSSVKVMHDREKAKDAGERYPSNQDAIGIELVGGYHTAKSLTESTDDQGQRTVTLQTDKGQTIVYERVSDEVLAGMQYEMTQKREIYEGVTSEQNASLKWLTEQLQSEFNVPDSEVFAHPVVSRKNQTEASTAQPH